MDPRVQLAFDRSLRSFDMDGCMHVESSNISKACVNPYYGREIPGWQQLGLDANRVYQMLRHPDELKAAAHTFRNKPLLITHRKVSADQPEQTYIGGTIGSDVSFDGTYLKSSLALWTAEAVKLVNTDQRELSCGYRYRPDMTPGEFEGVAYDGVMRDIVGNHVALVREGRAGPDVLVADQNPPLEFSTMRFAKFLAALAPLFATAPTQDVLTALDAALDEDLKAAGGTEETSDEETPVALDAAAVAAQIAAAKAEAKAEVTATLNALHEARIAVAPIVGDVALDSAEGVYKFALDKMGVDLKDVPAAAYAAVFKVAAKVKQAPAAPALAVDSASSGIALRAFPGLKAIR